jgi:hypothetical protein
MKNFFKKQKKGRYKIYHTHIRIYKLSLNEFMKYNPPCKECLVQAICVEDTSKTRIYSDHIYTRKCEFLIEFMSNCKSLTKFISNTEGFFQK